MNEEASTLDKKMTNTTDDLIRKLVRTPDDQRIFLKTKWINQVMLQLIQARFDAGLSQKELGERMGKHQSAIARLERWDDIKLSTLFDYLAALDLTPDGVVPLRPYSEATKRFAEQEDVEAGDASASEFDEPKVLAAD